MDGKRMGNRDTALSSDSIEVSNPQEMSYLGNLFAKTLRGNEMILLEGPLGAGKTTFTQGIGACLSISEPILSPTFLLMREYGNPVTLIHIDLYRVDSSEQLEDLGFQEIMNREVIRIVEWADKFPGLNTLANYQIQFSITSEHVRKVDIHAL